MEQAFLKERGFPNPTQCPSCRQMRRLNLRGGRELHKAICQECGKETIVSYNPATVTQKILCKKDFDDYWTKNDAILSDPLPTE